MKTPTKFYMVWLEDPFDFCDNKAYHMPFRPFCCSADLADLLDGVPDTGNYYCDLLDNIFFSEEAALEEHGACMEADSSKKMFIVEFDL